MLAVLGSIATAVPLAAEQLADVIGQNNTMGVCCFGEQGMNPNRQAIHGNLMFGCLLFSNKMRESKDSSDLPSREIDLVA